MILENRLKTSFSCNPSRLDLSWKYGLSIREICTAPAIWLGRILYPPSFCPAPPGLCACLSPNLSQSCPFSPYGRTRKLSLNILMPPFFFNQFFLTELWKVLYGYFCKLSSPILSEIVFFYKIKVKMKFAYFIQ